MTSVYIYHHLGLGDHIICNSIIRIYAKKYDKVFHFVKPNNFENVAFMYRDLKNLYLLKMQSHEIDQFLNINPSINIIRIGYTKEYFKKLADDVYNSFDIGFYDMASIDLVEKWNSFYIKRDIKREKEVFYDILSLKDNDKFIFIHEDSNRNFLIDRNRMVNDVRIISAEDFKNVRVFDFLFTIERAHSVNVMASSFYCLIDTAQIATNELVLHDYVNISMGQDIHTDTAGFLKYKLNWKILR